MTKLTKNKANTSKDKKLFFFSLGVFLVTLAIVLFVLVKREDQPESIAHQAVPSAENAAVEPQVIANLTQIPESLAEAGNLTEQTTELQAMVNACDDYGEDRRKQMKTHILWLLDSSTLSTDMIIALGSNPAGKLILGMATYTSSEWGLKDQSADSCLLPIGRLLNQMLVVTGEEPFSVFEETKSPQ